MDHFKLVSEFQPTGDQPEAIDSLVTAIENGIDEQVLLGVTGSGKTFTMANVIARLNRPTLVLAHNKTLAAQLCSEFKEFFPENAVEYFVSYYDYYQPEAYIPHTDTFIEKDASINDEIERLRHSATSSLFERRDVIVVASVSCIYGLGDPIDYANMVISLRPGQTRDFDELLHKLIDIRYERNDIAFERNKFRVRGDTLEIFPAYSNDRAIRVEFFGDEVDRISEINVVTGEPTRILNHAAIYPASHYVTTREKMASAIERIRVECDERVRYFEENNKLLEAQRIRQRTRFEVDVDSEKLIADAVAGIQGMPKVKPLEVLSTRADLTVAEGGVDAQATGTSFVKTGGTRVYDLPDPIAELQDAVGLTRATLKGILEGCRRFDEFEIDPATFLAQVAQKIEKAKGEAIAEGIKYTKLPDEDWYTMEDLDPGELKAYLGQNAWMPKSGKSLYSYVVYDSSTVEQPFAVELDLAEEVRVFAKLPNKFKIDTPLGSYNPDWAYVVEEDGERRVYFVVETKGGGNNNIRVSDAERTKIRCARRHFAALQVDIEYDVRTTYRS